ncbi:MAG: hypothetical protein Q9186_007337 [Xanthomendoza sp. 1 TL-2023]
MHLRDNKTFNHPPPGPKAQAKKKIPNPRNNHQGPGIQKQKDPKTAPSKDQKGKIGKGAKTPRRETQKAKAQRLERERIELERQRENLQQERERYEQERRDAQLMPPPRPLNPNREPTNAATAEAANDPPETAAEPQRTQRLQVNPSQNTIKFRLKPYYKPLGPLDPRPAGVPKKVKERRGQVLLPLGKPYWRHGRKGELELRLPMLADMAELQEHEFRKKGEGMMGKIMDYLVDKGKKGNEQDERKESTLLLPYRADEEQYVEEWNKEEELKPPQSPESDLLPYSPDSVGRQEPLDTPPEIRPRSFDIYDPYAEVNDPVDDPEIRNASFLSTHHGYEEGWIGRKVFGKGGEGRAGLFEKIDQDGVVVDKIVIKQKGDGGDRKLRKPAEVVIMEDLKEYPNNGIVRLVGYRRYPEIMAHRLYLEYCQHGDLEDLIDRYREKKQYFPEEFIWDVFHHLVNACKAMDRGPSPAKQKHPELTTYVHRDIKLENIFLAAPKGYDVDGTPIYPTAKLGDFGLAIATGEDDDQNPLRLREIGTPGYRAPEQKQPQEAQVNFPEDEREFVPQAVNWEWPRLGTPTNIWGVGVCIYKLLLLTDAYFDLQKAYEEKTGLAKLETHRTPEYSRALLNLVYDCLKIDPNRRPNFQKLDQVIEKQRASFRKSWSTGEPVTEEAKLRLTNDELNGMEMGPFVRRRHVPEL